MKRLTIGPFVRLVNIPSTPGWFCNKTIALTKTALASLPTLFIMTMKLRYLHTSAPSLRQSALHSFSFVALRSPACAPYSACFSFCKSRDELHTWSLKNAPLPGAKLVRTSTGECAPQMHLMPAVRVTWQLKSFGSASCSLGLKQVQRSSKPLLFHSSLARNLLKLEGLRGFEPRTYGLGT